MITKHKINYMPIFSVLTLVSLIGVLLVIEVWMKDFLGGILAMTLLIVLEILGIRQLFAPQRIKSVTVTSSSIIIEYRKTSVEVPYEDCKKIEHDKHGPLTERITVYAKDYFYEISFDLKHFHEMCKEIYTELSNINMAPIADEWFQKKFGKEVSLNDNQCINDSSSHATAKYSANYRLMWTLMIVQFILVLFLTIIIWSRIDIIFKIILPITVLFVEYLIVLVIISPRLTRSVTITANGIIVEFKKKHIEIPITSFELVKYDRRWPYPKRVTIFTNKKQYGLLPWYIKDFRGMCRSVYQALENAHMESIADKSFQKKFGNTRS